jgi:hypothetical protein
MPGGFEKDATLKLLQSFFGAKPAAGSKFDASLIDSAIDHAIEATDPRAVAPPVAIPRDQIRKRDLLAAVRRELG